MYRVLTTNFQNQAKSHLLLGALRYVFFVQQKICWSEDLGGCSAVGSIVGSSGLQYSVA